MPEPFDSSYRKLARAEKHFAELQVKVGEFTQNSPYARVIDPHPDKPGYEIHKVRPTRELRGEWDDIGDIFGEFVQNIRGALDNAAYAIAVATGKPDAKNCAFPFARSLGQMVNAVGRCADLPKEIQSFFCGFQPYFGGDDILAAINEACNTDKHKTLVPAFNVFQSAGIAISGNGRFYEMPLKHVWDDAKNEMVLVTLGPGTEDQFAYNFQFSVLVAIDKIEGVKGQPVLGTAYAMGCKVHGILGAIEAESRRLKITT